MSKKVLVYGAAGAQGRPVVHRLLQEGYHVRALVHHPEKGVPLMEAGAETVLGELADRDSLDRASEDMDAVFLFLPPVFNLNLAMTYLENAVEAAKQAGIKLLVYSTSGGFSPEPSNVSHFEVKRHSVAYLKEAGMPTIILQPVVYLENLAAPPLLEAIRYQGVIPFPYEAQAPVSWISILDHAAFVVEAIKRPELAGSSFVLGGPETLTGPELAERIGRVLERPLQYYPVPPDFFEQQLAPQLGAITAHEVAEVYRWHARYGTEAVTVRDMSPVLEKLPVRLTSVEDWFKNLLSNQVPA